ncbi:MAG: hypothetical protein P8Z00_01145 [Anaerolineales bacterium]|jgi:hypothetical protein
MTEVPEKVIVYDSGVPPMRVVYPETLAGMVCFWAKGLGRDDVKPMGEFKYVKVEKAARSGRALIVKPAGYELYYSNFVDQETARSISSTLESGSLGGEFYFHHKGGVMLAIFRPSKKKSNVGWKSYSSPVGKWERG